MRYKGTEKYENIQNIILHKIFKDETILILLILLTILNTDETILNTILRKNKHFYRRY